MTILAIYGREKVQRWI